MNRAVCETPLFTEPLHVGKPFVLRKDVALKRISEALDRSWLTNDGPFVKEFEQKIVEITGKSACVAVNNATAGLELCLRALGIKGEVCVPSFTFVASAHSCLAAGLTPRFGDIDAQTHLLAENCVQPEDSAVLTVDLWGQPATPETLGKPVICDAAHAMGCSKRKPVALADVYSFHATKCVNSAEGGAIVTDDLAFASELRSMRNFGFSGLDQVSGWGTNAKMNELNAALGLTNLEDLPEIQAKQKQNRADYRKAFAASEFFAWMDFTNEHDSNHQYAVVRLKPDFVWMRDEVVNQLWANNVRARRYFFPGCHRMKPYDQMKHGKLKNTEFESARTLVLPNGPDVTSQICVQIASLMEEIAHELQRNPYEVAA